MSHTGQVEDRETGEIILQEDRETGEVIRHVVGPGGGEPARAPQEEPARQELICVHGEEATNTPEEEPTNPTQEQSANTHQEEPSKPSQEQPASTTQGEPTNPTQEEPNHTQEEPTNLTQEEATNPTQEEATNPTQEEATNPTQEEATNPTQEEATNPTQEEATNLIQEEATNLTQEEATNPTQEEATDPTQEEATDPTQEEATDPTQEEATDPTQEEATDPTQEEATNPTQEEATNPAQEEATNPAQEEATNPAQEEATNPTQEEATNPTQEEATNPTQEEATNPTQEEATNPTQEEATNPTQAEATNPTQAEATNLCQEQETATTQERPDRQSQEEPAELPCPRAEPAYVSLTGGAVTNHRGRDQDEAEAEEHDRLIHEDGIEEIGFEATDEEIQEQDPQPAETCSWPSWLSWAEIPVHYRSELWKLLILAVPMLIFEFLNFMILISSLKVFGNTSLNEHSIVALAVAVFNITTISVGNGLTQACDTVISQAFGSGNLRRVGVFLQRGILLMCLASFPVWTIQIYTEPFLLYITGNTLVARVAQQYIYHLMITAPCYFLFQLQVKYLRNQGYVTPQIWTAVAGCFLNLLLYYVFLDYLITGVAGAALTTLVCYCTMPVFIALIMVSRGIQKKRWTEWSQDSYQEWGSFVQPALLNVVAVCLQSWLFDIWVFLDGYSDKLELGTRNMVYSVYMAAFTISQGFTAAASVRVGNAVGAGNRKEAKLAAKVAVFCGVAVGLIVGAFMAALKDYSGYIVFSNSEMVQRTADVLLLFSLLFVIDTTAAVMGGVLRGAGKVLPCALTAVIRLAFGLFIGRILKTKEGHNIFGLGLCIIAGVVFQLLVFSLCLYFLDWRKAVIDARWTAGVIVINNEMELKDEDEDSEDDPEPAPVQVQYVKVMGEPLSKRQLWIRRGGAAGVAVLTFLSAFTFRSYVMSLLR